MRSTRQCISAWLKLFCIMLPAFSYSQSNPEVNPKFAKIAAYDTNYIFKYNSQLVFGPCAFFRNYNIILYPKVPIDSISAGTIQWRSPSDLYFGIDFNYDKFGITLSLASSPTKSATDKSGNSESYSVGFSYGGNRCFIETYLMSFKGFYEKNPVLRDSGSSNYYQSANLVSTLFKFKAWYFTNHHKFAFKSCYGGLYRQVKTQASWAFSSNLHINTIQTDSSVLPDPDLRYADNDLTVRALNCIGVSVSAGAAVNFVIKRAFFLNIAYVLGPDFQSLTAYTNEASSGYNRQYVNFSNDIRAAIGINLKRWYCTWAFNYEMNRFGNDLIKIKTNLNSHSLSLGYRFNTKRPAFYSKFQNTWLYSIF